LFNPLSKKSPDKLDKVGHRLVVRNGHGSTELAKVKPRRTILAGLIEVKQPRVDVRRVDENSVRSRNQ